MKTPKITKANIDTIRQIIVAYEKHDSEAFATRTGLFKLATEMAKMLKKLL